MRCGNPCVADLATRHYMPSADRRVTRNSGAQLPHNEAFSLYLVGDKECRTTKRGGGRTRFCAANTTVPVEPPRRMTRVSSHAL